MKAFVVLAISIVLMIILSCPMLMAAPPMPNDVQIVQPDPSLPKELLAFFGKWEGSSASVRYAVIVEKIDEEKASIYRYKTALGGEPAGWQRYEAKVAKERGKYILWYTERFGTAELTVKGQYLSFTGIDPNGGSVRFSRP